MADDRPESRPDETPQAEPADAPEVMPEEATDDTSDDDGFVAITVNGELLAVPVDMSLGAGLLLHGVRVLRQSPHEKAPRGLFCGMGVCFECLVTVDGRAGQQACRLRVRDGMTVELPESVPMAEADHG